MNENTPWWAKLIAFLIVVPVIGIGILSVLWIFLALLHSVRDML